MHPTAHSCTCTFGNLVLISGLNYLTLEYMYIMASTYINCGYECLITVHVYVDISNMEFCNFNSGGTLLTLVSRVKINLGFVACIMCVCNPLIICMLAFSYYFLC